MLFYGNKRSKLPIIRKIIFLCYQLKENKKRRIKHIELKTLATSILIQNLGSNNFDIIFKLLDMHKDELFGSEEKEELDNALNDEDIIDFLQKEGN